MSDPVPGSAPARPDRTPPLPLAVASALVGLEALLLLGLAVLEVASLVGSRLTMGLTTAAFFLAGALGLGACAWGLWRGRRWGRGPALLAQLITLGLAWNLRGGSTGLVAIALAVLAAVVVAGLIHPTTVDILEDRGAERT